MSKHNRVLSIDRRWQTWPTCLLLMFSFSGSVSAQTINIVAVTNSADFAPGLAQKGSLATIFCTGVQGEQGVVSNTQYPLSNRVNDISVWVNSVPAPILAIAFQNGYQQINIQVPWDIYGDPLDVVVSQSDRQAHSENTRPVDFNVFFVNANGYEVIRHSSDLSQVSVENPAHSGEDLIAYGINLGPVQNTPPSGAVTPSDPLSPSVAPGPVCQFTVSLQIGTLTAIPSYVGLAPDTVGVYQIAFQLPQYGDVGNLPMTLVTTTRVFPFGQCPPSGLGVINTAQTSRSVLVPIR